MPMLLPPAGVAPSADRHGRRCLRRPAFQALQALLLALGAGCGGEPVDPDLPQFALDAVQFSLLQRSDLWEASTPEGGEVRAGSLRPRRLGGDVGVLPTLIMSPPAVVRIELPVLPPDARLRFATGLGGTEYRAGRAGVRFEVEVDARTVHREVRRPNETTQVRQREWHRAEVPVRSRSTVVLRTESVGEGEPPREVGFGLLEVVCSESLTRVPATATRPNLVLVCIDTLRADRLSCYGYASPTSPTLDRLALEGTLFEHAYAPSPWTWPSTASLLTGLSPPEHGLLDRNSCFLSHELETLPEQLQRLGFTTGGFSTNGLITASKGFAQGFEHFAEYDWLDTDRFLPDVFGWLEEAHDWRFFLYLHLTEPHLPYAPPTDLEARFAAGGPDDYDPLGVNALYAEFVRQPAAPASELEIGVAHESRLYDAEIAAVDRRLGRLFERLNELGVGDHTVIAITSDHGEEFLDHRLRGHGKQLFEESVHVPLILRGPGVPVAHRVARPVENRWLAPTLARLMGAPVDEGQSVDLLDPAALARRQDPIFFTTQRSQWLDVAGAQLLQFPALHAVQVDGRRLIWAPEADGQPGLELLFDVVRDPGMQRDLTAATPLAERESLKYQIGAWLERGRAVRPEALDGGDSALEMLRELGYVE